MEGSVEIKIIDLRTQQYWCNICRILRKAKFVIKVYLRRASRNWFVLDLKIVKTHESYLKKIKKSHRLIHCLSTI